MSYRTVLLRSVIEECEQSPKSIQNDSDQWLAAKGLSMPPGFIASPLHRLVRIALR
jgi:hypothetical protein